MHNFPKNPIILQSQKTGKFYTFNYADDVSLDENTVAQIAKVCDEPEIYDNVFADIFRGKRYTEDNARVFTKIVLEGCLARNRFDWLILNESVIVGTIGIKSLNGEIGYWQSNKHPGVMILATQALCSLAKEARLFFFMGLCKKIKLSFD